MASVRIEDEAFADVRIKLLAELAGYNEYEALGRLAHLWRLCTQRGAHVLSELLVRSCLGPRGVQAIIESELGDRSDDGIRIHGTSGRIEWLKELAEKRVKAGRTRAAAARRDSRGRLISPEIATSSTVEQNQSLSPANVQHNPANTSTFAKENSASPAHQQMTSTPPACDQHMMVGSPAQSSALTLTLTLKEEEREGAKRASTTKSEKVRRAKRAEIPIPEDWAPNESAHELARELGLDVTRETRAFRDHALSKARLLVDWQAGFRTWLGKASEFQPPRHRGNGVSPPEYKPL